MRMRSILAFAFTTVISFPALAAITGSAINTDGQPLSGAKVSLFAPETADARRARLLSKSPLRPALVTATTDSKGNFSIDSPKEPVLDLRIEAAGYAPEGTRVIPDEEIGALALVAAPAKTGMITAAGKPLPDAVVIFGGRAEYTTITDGNGKYSVPDPAKWANRLVILSPDFAVLNEILGGPLGTNKKGLDRALDSGATIRGRVFAQDGTSPVPGVPVFVDQWRLATTAEDGTFTVAHAPKDWSLIEARIDSRAGMRAHAAGDVTIKLAKAASVSGVVSDAKTAMPLPGVEVRLIEGARAGMSGVSLRSAFTNAKGVYTLLPVLPGAYQIAPMRPGYVAPNVSVTVAAGQAAQKSLSANPRGRIVGSVVDEDKRAVAGAHVDARPAARDQMPMMGFGRNGNEEATAYSAADGRFVLRSVPVESDVQLDALKKGYPSGRSASLRLAPAERKAGVVITLPHGVALMGKVTDKDGRALSGVAVEPVEATNERGGFGGVRRMVVNLMQTERAEEFVKTGSDGSFNIRVKEGTYDVVFKREGFAAKTVRGEAVHAGAKPLAVTLEPGVEITGRVTRGGVGIAGVNINAMAQDAMTNAVTGADGSFRLEDLTPGQMMLNVMKREDFIQQVRPVTAPAQNVTIDLPAGGRIIGRVVDKASHDPVSSFQAGISTSRGGGGMVMMTPPMLKPFTSDDGTFTLENVPAGPTQIVVMAPGYTTARVPGVNVEEGKTVSDVEVAMETGVKLTGRVTGPDGTPLAGVSVRPDNAGGRMMRFDGGDSTTITDPGGEYTLDALEPGEKTFTFNRQGYLSESRTITLSSASTRLDVQLSTGSRLTGSVVSDAGGPVADAIVTASSATQSGFGGRQARTDASGNFELEGLAPGHYMLSATKTGYSSGVLRDFDITGGAPARIVMQSGGSVMGHVSGLTPAELQSAIVQVQSPNGNATGPVDSTGSYRIDGAPSGTVRVSARTGQMFGTGKTSPMKSAQVDPGGTTQVDLEFTSATVVRGHVTRDGQPMGNAGIAFFPRGAQASTSASSTTDSGGNYEISGLDDATYNVRVMDFQKATPFTTTYEVKGSGTFDIDIRSASVRGRVTDASTGAPIADARVEIHASSSDAVLTTRAVPTDVSGNFVIDTVPRGTYDIRADKEGYGHDIRSIVVGDSADPIEFKLSPSSGVTLTVVDARDNRMLAANILRVVDPQGRDVDTAPMFRFSGTPQPINLSLAPGAYRVTLAAIGYAAQTFTVTSPSNPTISMSPGGTVVIRSKSNTTTRARLVDSNGMAYVRGFGGASGVFTIDASPGVTTLQNVAPGSFSLQILGAADQVLKTIPVNVVDGQATPVEVN